MLKEKPVAVRIGGKRAGVAVEPEVTPATEGMHEPEWEVALLFPPRGAWSEDDYLELDTNRLVELSDGCLEVLPMPTDSHQLILFYLARLLAAFVEASGLGTVLPASLPVRLWEGKFREPDVVFIRTENDARRQEQYWEGADLVMEVVSGDPKGRKRDLETKPQEYARAGIPEYWIVDPQEQRIRVLVLEGPAYRVHGEFAPGEEATSVLLPGFSVPVDRVFTAAS